MSKTALPNPRLPRRPVVAAVRGAARKLLDVADWLAGEPVRTRAEIVADLAGIYDRMVEKAKDQARRELDAEDEDGTR